MTGQASPFHSASPRHAAHLEAVDWARTPLGPPPVWPDALRTALGICLASPVPAVIFWGSELTTLYNDACVPVMGSRHPASLGRPAPAVLDGAWALLRPHIDAAFRNGGAGDRAQVPLGVEREGDVQDTLFSWSIVPVATHAGSTGGVLCSLTDDTEQLRLRLALAETRRRLDSALIAGEVGTFEWDVAADRLWGDPNFARMFSITLDATGAAPLADYLAAIHPDDRAAVTERIRQTLETGADYAAEYRIISGSEPRWVVVRGKVERDTDGRVLRFPGVAIDVTEGRRAEAARRESEQKYRTLFESIDAGFCIIEMIFDGDVATDYRFLEYNSAFEKHTGLRDAQGRTARELLPELEAHWFELYGNVARTGAAARFESGSDVMGRWFDVFAFPMDGEPSGRVALLFNDVSEQKRTEAALRTSRQRFRAVLENSLDAAYRRDLRTDTYDYISPTINQVIGVSAEDLRTMPVADAVERVHPDDRERVRAAMDKGLEHGEGRVEYRFLAGDGSYRFVADHFTVQTDEDGRPAWRTGVLRDVTNAKRAEEELRQAKEAAEQASLAKSQFLAVMSHELRTPLSGVIGFTDLLESEVLGEINARQRESLARIKASSWHLVGIIDDILTISRAEGGKADVSIEEVDVAALTREVVRIVEPQAEAGGVVIHVRADEPIRLRTDSRKVRQILINLIGNAVKYGEGAAIAVTAAATDDGVVVSVTDAGPGIAAEDLERIFEAFTQVDSSHSRRGSGVGLGLAISRRLARLLGGDVVVESEVGAGSTFTLRLPPA